MRKPAFRKAVRGLQVSQQHSIPAPVGGWNARDSLAEMPETDAVRLLNWFPETTDVRVRKGYASHLTAVTGQVESLMPYNASDGTQMLFAAAADSFYDATTAGGAGAAVQSGLSNARWQHVNYTNSSGTSFLCAFNGVDAPRYWDGAAWTAITGVSTPAITGVTTTSLISAAVHKRRIWLVEVGTLKAWYLPPDSVGGAAAAFDLSGICKQGGYLMALETWTLDSGEGIDDLLVGVTSEGQVVVAKGTDPTSSNTWFLVGVWNIGEPIGRRCMIKYKGDVLILCKDGVYALSTALIGSQAAEEQALTYKITQAMAVAVESYGANFGWQLLHYAAGHQLILNVPVAEGSEQQQYTMNTITGSWCNYDGINANCWAVSNGECYFGGDGEVNKFGGIDAFGDDGADIEADLKQAFSYFKTKGRLKHWKSMRPNLLINNNVDIAIAMDVDFGNQAMNDPLAFTLASVGVWDTGLWDADIWGGDVAPFNRWLTVAGVGTAGAVRINLAGRSDVRLTSTDHVYEYGGVIG